jgi:hypothetical protein
LLRSFRAKESSKMAIERDSGGSSLVEVLDRVLDKGIVVDAWVRVSLVGIELVTIEARVVIASVDTYLRYAQAIVGTPQVSRPRGVEARDATRNFRGDRRPARAARAPPLQAEPQPAARARTARPSCSRTSAPPRPRRAPGSARPASSSGRG